jgi:hypothetical protein
LPRQGTWVAGAADEKVVAVVRQVLEALYVGYGDAVDAYVGLLEPGSNTLRCVAWMACRVNQSTPVWFGP